MKKEEREREKKITRALHRVSPRTKSGSQSTLLWDTSGWLLPMRSIIRKKKNIEVTFNGTLMWKIIIYSAEKGRY